MCFPYFPVPFGDLAAATRRCRSRDGEPFQVGPMTVRPFPVNHPQGAHGFRIECDGATLVYATDYEHGDPVVDEGMREAVRDADVLISDAQYTPDEYALREGWGHTTWEQAALLARDSGVGRLVLFHHDPAHDDAALGRICDRARACLPQPSWPTRGWRSGCSPRGPVAGTGGTRVRVSASPFSTRRKWT